VEYPALLSTVDCVGGCRIHPDPEGVRYSPRFCIMTGSAAETNMVGFDFSSPIWHTVLASDADSSADSYPILDSVDRQAQLVSADVYDAPTYTVDVIVEDSEGTAISGATVEIDGQTLTTNSTGQAVV